MRARQWMLLTVTIMAGLVMSACSESPTTDELPAGTIQLRGAGATFPAPLYEKWLAEYQQKRPDVRLSYEAIGSGDGTKQFMAGEVDFGASDAAMKDTEIAQVERGVQLIPVVAGSIVLAYNIEGLGGELKLPRDVYTDIFLGHITTWNNLRIQEANPDLQLPRQTIAVVVRQDSSGTTYAFTNHLSTVSSIWRDKGPGVGKVIDWPGGAMSARGNDGVAGRIKQSANSIGYVEYGTAQRAGLKMALLANKAGHYVRPDGESGMATLQNVALPDNLRAFFPDPDGAQSYPIVTYSWLLLYQQYGDTQKAKAIKDYVKWCLTDGQSFNESLGYVRLAPTVIARAIAAVDRIQ